MMIAQRSPDAASVIKQKWSNPLAGQTVDAAMAVLTPQHWENVETGLRELMRMVRDHFCMATPTDPQIK